MHNVSRVLAYALYSMLGLCAMSNLLNIAGELASQGFFKLHFVNKTDATTEVDTKENNEIANTDSTLV